MSTETNPTATHTHGPWKVEEWNIGESHLAQTVIRGCNDAIAYVQDLWCPDDREAERDANARLIAAAPEMLEALRGCARIVGEYRERVMKGELTGKLIPGDAEPYFAACAAISKAVGDHKATQGHT